MSSAAKLFPNTTHRLEAIGLGLVGVTVCAVYLACHMTKSGMPLANSSGAVIAASFIAAVVAGPLYVPLALAAIYFSQKNGGVVRSLPVNTPDPAAVEAQRLINQDPLSANAGYNPGGMV